MRPRPVLGSLLVALAACLGACSTAGYRQRADAEVARLLRAKRASTVGDREQRVRYPAPAVASAAEGTEHQEPEELRLDLAHTLALAVQGNRDYAARRETLYLTMLGLLGTRHDFTPQLASLLAYNFSDADLGGRLQSAGWSLDATQILPWGGTVAVNGALAAADTEFGEPVYSTSLGVSLIQPLLRGAGYEVSHEALVQAERTAVYEIRNFELFREDFSIDVASRFYGLVRSRTEIQNQEENLERSTFDLQKAEALFRVGRSSEIESLRAKRQNLNSQNALIAAQQRYEQELDAFRIFLGLPESARILIEDTPPPFVEVSYDLDSATGVALENRLDVLNRREQLQDSQRGVRIARNALLPDLDLAASGALASDEETELGDLGLDRGSYSAGISLGLPLDRYDERNALRSAEIGLARAERDLDEFEQRVRADVRNALRELERRRRSVTITRELIVGEVKNKRIAEIQFERGRIDNRELVDAEQSLLDARNNLINEQVNYEIARLQLLRDLGILFIDENGLWKP